MKGPLPLHLNLFSFADFDGPLGSIPTFRQLDIAISKTTKQRGKCEVWNLMMLRATAAGKWPVFPPKPPRPSTEARRKENDRRDEERRKAQAALNYLTDWFSESLRSLEYFTEKMNDKCVSREWKDADGRWQFEEVDPERWQYYRENIGPLKRDVEEIGPAIKRLEHRLASLAPLSPLPGKSNIDLQNFIDEMRASWLECGLGEPGKGATGPFVQYVEASLELRGKQAPIGLGKRIQEQAVRDNWPGHRPTKLKAKRSKR